MRVALIYETVRPDTWGQYFHRAFHELGHEVRAWTFSLAPEVPEGMDLYVRIDDGDHYEDGLPPQCRPSVFWVSDTHLEGPMRKLLTGAHQYDLVCCAMFCGAERLQAAGIPAVWVGGGACDPAIHRRISCERIYDVGFVGTDGGSPRKFYLQILRERYPAHWIGGAAHTDMARIYSASKIVFNYCPAQDTLTMRCFEAMACGALLMLNEVPGHTHERMGLTPGTHFILYRQPRELLEQIDHYLSREAERKRIAEAGYEETLARHTYTHRVQQMLEVAVPRLRLRGVECSGKEEFRATPRVLCGPRIRQPGCGGADRC